MDAAQAKNNDTSNVRRRDPFNFIYDPLNSQVSDFRLLQIADGNPQEAIKCNLIAASIDDVAGSYTALSYTWGEVVPKSLQHPIFVNEQEFFVRDNLFSFLETQRRLGTSTTFWIDAICIDQENVLEKNHQVGLMGNIFSRAKEVHVWLGGQSPLLASAFVLLDNLQTQAEFSGGLHNHFKLSSYSLVSNFDGFHQAMLELFSLPYWRRIWVIQEVQLAKNVLFHYAEKSIKLDTLKYSHAHIASRRTNVPLPFALDSKAHPGEHNLAELIVSFADRECTAFHDHVYALLGLAKDWTSSQNGLLIDYNTTPDELIASVLEFCDSADAYLIYILLRYVSDAPSGAKSIKNHPLAYQAYQDIKTRDERWQKWYTESRNKSAGQVLWTPPRPPGWGRSG